MLVLDCSVTMAWLFNDEKTATTDRLLEQLVEQEAAIVPALWQIEVANVLLVAERKNRITTAQSMQFLDLLQNLQITVEPQNSNATIQTALELARNYKLSMYDAVYLDLTVRKGLPIASLDKELLKAAKKCGILAFFTRS